MSVSARLISGTVASWVQIAITLLSQVILVPLYLSYWDVKTYGVWLAMIAFTGVLNTLDLGYQEYLAYEFLKMGKDNTKLISKHLSSGLLLGLLLGIFQMLIILVLYGLGFISILFNESSALINTDMINDICIVLLMQGFAWMVFGSVGGILGRGMHVFGHYPRMAWWGVFSSVAINLAPAMAVGLGADLLTTGITMAIARLLSSIPICIDMILLFKKAGVRLRSPTFMIGWNDFTRSLYLCFAGLLENMRHQGARMLLTPLAGITGLAAFSTMRTGSNVAMQGLHTITHPLMPELISFLHKRDQTRSDVAFVTIWIVVVVALAPALLVLQLIVQPLYLLWTKNQIPFDPWLFATLSMGILVYAISQPAIAVVRGNNLLKSQVFISGIAGTITILGMFILVPFLGISGAGLALLLAEISANIYYTSIAKKWLEKNDMKWPVKISSITITSVGIAFLGISLLIVIPGHKSIISISSLVLLTANICRFWMSLPTLATDRVKNILSKLPGLRSVLST
jgi:O-antigen/teichoic acid export membrane protein